MHSLFQINVEEISIAEINSNQKRILSANYKVLTYDFKHTPPDRYFTTWKTRLLNSFKYSGLDKNATKSSKKSLMVNGDGKCLMNILL